MDGDVINFTEQNLFQCFSNVDKKYYKNKIISDEEYYGEFIKTLPESLKSDSKRLNEILKPHLRKYKRKKKSRQLINSIVENASNEILFSEDCSLTDASGDGPSQSKRSRGPECFSASFTHSYKDFVELTEGRQRVITQPLVDMLTIFLNVSNYSISINQLLGYLLMRENAQSKKQQAYSCGQSLFFNEGNDTDGSERIKPIEAVSLMHTLSLSKEDMRCLRYFLKEKNIDFPTTNDLLETRKMLRPESTSVLDGRGRSVDYKETVSMTVSSILSVIQDQDQDYVPSKAKLYLKDGCDGAGSMPKLKSKQSVSDAEHIFQYGFIPLKLTETDENGVETAKWENQVMNSPSTFRSVYTIREKENNDELLELVIKNTDKARNDLNQMGIDLSLNAKNIHINIDIKDSMKDLKFKKMVSGLGGADCLLCKSKQADWTDLAKIEDENSFKINRNAADTRNIFNSVVDSEGNIKTNPNDFEVRSGVTKQPISDSDQHSITITHSYINGCSWFLKVLYHCYIDLKVWTEKEQYLCRLNKAKDEVRDVIQKSTGLRLDQVNSVCAKGGTSTDGKQARRFFEAKTEQVLQELLGKNSNKKHKDNIIALHRNISIILRVISCTRLVEISKFNTLCKNTMVIIATKFPWARLNHTLHGSIQHSAELMEMNGSRGLGGYSEEGLEANNKDVRKFLENLSRKSDSNKQLEDVHHRILERSDPYVGYITTQYRQRKICSLCQGRDHTIRTHDKHYLCEISGLEDYLV